jgi:hypothetical protein
MEEQLAASLRILKVSIEPGDMSLCTADHFQATIVNKTIEKTVLAK